MALPADEDEDEEAPRPWEGAGETERAEAAEAEAGAGMRVTDGERVACRDEEEAVAAATDVDAACRDRKGVSADVSAAMAAGTAGRAGKNASTRARAAEAGVDCAAAAAEAFVAGEAAAAARAGGGERAMSRIRSSASVGVNSSSSSFVARRLLLDDAEPGAAAPTGVETVLVCELERDDDDDPRVTEGVRGCVGETTDPNAMRGRLRSRPDDDGLLGTAAVLAAALEEEDGDSIARDPEDAVARCSAEEGRMAGDGTPAAATCAVDGSAATDAGAGAVAAGAAAAGAGG